MKLLMSTKQFKMYLEDELVERLERVAERNGRRSAQQVAEEILLTYLPVWTAVSDAMARAVTYQSTHEERKPERHLAPVVARIAPAIDREPSRAEVRRMINADEIDEIERRITPRKTQRIPQLKQKAK